MFFTELFERTVVCADLIKHNNCTIRGLLCESSRRSQPLIHPNYNRHTTKRNHLFINMVLKITVILINRFTSFYFTIVVKHVDVDKVFVCTHTHGFIVTFIKVSKVLCFRIKNILPVYLKHSWRLTIETMSFWFVFLCKAI